MREIRVDHVSKSFGKAKALDDVSLSFEHGKIHALLGRNGAGKSTLLGLIANRLVPTSGRILVDGEPAADNARALTKLYCMNDKKMYPENLRLDNLFEEMGRFYEGFDRTDAARHAKAFGLDARKKIGALSTGYRSIYQLVVGLSLDVDYLLLDEPVSSLDIKHQVGILSLVNELVRDSGLLCVCVLHDLNLASHYCSEIVLMKQGRIVRHGPTETVLQQDILEEVYDTKIRMLHENDGSVYIFPEMP